MKRRSVRVAGAGPRGVLVALLVAACSAEVVDAALSPGDIALIGYHGNGATTSSTSGDAFAWVPLVNLPAGEVLHFSDTGYFSGVASNNGFGGAGGGTDGLISFTVPTGGIPFGQVQTVGNAINPTPAPYSQPSNAYLNANGASDASHLNFSTSGDQLIAFQDDDLSDTTGFQPLFALNGASSDWSSGVASDRNQTNLYPGLQDGDNAVSVGAGPGPQDSYSNARYIGPTTGGQEQLLARIADPANWEGSNGVSQTGDVLSWITNDVTQYGDGSAALRVLMIGNSYTQGTATARATYVDLQGFLDAAPGIDATVTNESFGGATLAEHASPGSDAVAELITSAGQYDVIVLQERSDRPGRAIKFGGGQLDGLNAGGPLLIEDYIKVHQPQAEVVLFNTWARHPDLEPAEDDDLATFFNDDPLEMQSFTNQGYQHILNGSPGGDFSDMASIARVGNAWEAWYATNGYSNAATLLHEGDGTHQNDLGAYLSAAVLFESITGESVLDSSYTGAVPDAGLASQLKQYAALVGAVGLPGDYNGDGIVDAADYTVWRDGLGGSHSQADYVAWVDNYGAALGAPSVNSVPEPLALVLSLAALASAGSSRRACRDV